MNDQELIDYRQNIEAILEEWPTLKGNTNLDQLRDFRSRVGQCKIMSNELKNYCTKMIRHWQSKRDECDLLKKRVEQLGADSTDEYFVLKDESKQLPRKG